MTYRTSDTLLTSTAPADGPHVGALGAQLENLQTHFARCHDIADAQMPKLVLSACQAIYNFEPTGDALVKRKRRVFEAICSGNTILAIRAVLPERISAHCGAKRDGAFAVLRDGLGTHVQTLFSSPERALLALAMECHARSQRLDEPQALFSAA